MIQAGILTSPPLLAAFPFRIAGTVAHQGQNGFLPSHRGKDRVTVAGPSPILTGFPIKLERAPERVEKTYEIWGGKSTADRFGRPRASLGDYRKITYQIAPHFCPYSSSCNRRMVVLM